MDETELIALKQEYRWLLDEIPTSLKDLQHLLLECVRRFPVQTNIIVGDLVKPDRFLLSSPNGSQNIKCMVTLLGDNICEGDISVKLHKDKASMLKSSIQPEESWKLQQIQDAGNHLLVAINKLNNYDENYIFKCGEEVTLLADELMQSLNKGRTCLVLPKRKSLDELLNNSNMKSLTPVLPQDYIISFYIHAQKLVMAVYHLTNNPQKKLEIRDRNQVECSVPWLNEVIILFTLALEMCQQIKDKVEVFSQYSLKLE